MTEKAEQLENLLLCFFPLILGLLVVPCPGSPTNSLVTPRLVLLASFLTIILVLRLARTLSQRRLPSLRDIPLSVHALLAFSLVGLISSWLSDQPYLSLFGSSSLQTGSLFTVLLAGLFITYSTAPKPVSPIGLYLLTAILSILAIIEFIGFRPLSFLLGDVLAKDSDYPIITIGFRGQLAGLFAFLSALTLTWLYHQQRNPVIWALFVLAVVALSTSSTTSAWIAFGFGLLIYLWIARSNLKHAYTVFILGFLLLCSSVFLEKVNSLLLAQGIVNNTVHGEGAAQNAATTHTRILLWKAAGRMFLARPVLGWGNQNFSNHWYDYLTKQEGDKLLRLELSIPDTKRIARVNDIIATKESGHAVTHRMIYAAPHNFFLEVAYSNGFIGVIMLLAVFISVSIVLRQRGSTAAVVPFIVYGVYLLGWFISVPTTSIVWIVVGMLSAKQSSSILISSSRKGRSWEIEKGTLVADSLS